METPGRLRRLHTSYRDPVFRLVPGPHVPGLGQYLSDRPAYTFGETAKAAGAPEEMWKSWVARGMRSGWNQAEKPLDHKL